VFTASERRKKSGTALYNPCEYFCEYESDAFQTQSFHRLEVRPLPGDIGLQETGLRKGLAMLSHQSDQQQVIYPAYRKVQRACLALCMVLAPLVIFLGFIFDPTGGVPPGGSATIAAFETASPLRVQLFLFFNVITPYFFPLSYLGLGLLAMKRSPWLATIGTAFGLIGSLPWPVFVAQEATVKNIAQIGSSAAFVTLFQHVSSEWAILLLFVSWIVGHLLGYILLGIALARARVIPLWASCLIIAGPPFQAVAYPTHLGLLQIFGFVLVFIGSIPAALVALKPPHN